MGDRVVVMNCRLIGDVQIEPHNPLGGEMIMVNCRILDEDTSDC